jgi:RNA polymerase sigma factor (sigma-70 family)
MSDDDWALKFEEVDQNMFDNFVRQIDRVGLRKKMATIAAIGQTNITSRAREKMFLHAALSYLPARERTLLHLRFWQDYSFLEVAEILGLPKDFVQSIFLLSLTFLERELRPYVMKSEEYVRGYLKVS